MTTPSSRHTTRRIAWTAIGIATTSLLAINAHAADDLHAAPQRAVDYADLDLSVPADADRLYTRLQNAAKRVCGRIDIRDLRRTIKQRECYQESLAAAVATVNHNSVTALYKADKSIKLADRRDDAAPRS
jgi:UrcA family protein